VIQQNASAAEESAATSQELAAQSQQLNSVIGYFQIGEGSTAMRGKKSASASKPQKSLKASRSHKTSDAFDLDLAADDNADADFKRYAG
jgi:methyl-accepting chemotaxis protein